MLSAAYRGLYESPLKEIYPVLDLEEAIAFAAGSWAKRNESARFSGYVASHSLYDVFSEVYGLGFPWLNKHKNIPDELKRSHIQLNPFSGRNLEQRLSLVPYDSAERLKERLAKPTRRHLFYAQYESEIRGRMFDPYELVCMEFQPNSYPPSKRKGEVAYQKQYQKMLGAFAGEIARRISTYPAEYFPVVDSPKPQDQISRGLAKEEEPKQLGLF